MNNRIIALDAYGHLQYRNRPIDKQEGIPPTKARVVTPDGTEHLPQNASVVFVMVNDWSRWRLIKGG